VLGGINARPSPRRRSHEELLRVPKGSEQRHLVHAGCFRNAPVGYIGKHGLLITPDTGPSPRIAAVYTQIEKPPYTDRSEHACIRDFCESWLKCVRSCPAGAISTTTAESLLVS
jgi:ferredoxin